MTVLVYNGIQPLLLSVTVLASFPRSLHSWQGKKNSVRVVGIEDRLATETRTVVMQELFDEVYVGEDHTPTAISFKLQFIKGITGKLGR